MQQADIFWTEAARLSKRIARKIKLDPRFIGGDVTTTKEDLAQEGLLAAASWLSRHENEVAADTSGHWRTAIYGVINTAIFSYLKEINRHSGRAFSASDWLENTGDEWGGAAIKTPYIEPESANRNRMYWNKLLKTTKYQLLNGQSPVCQIKFKQLFLFIVMACRFTDIARKMNFSRERQRQLYHEHMRALKAEVERHEKPAELPLVYPDQESENMLYSSHDEKILALKFRVRSTLGNISNSTRMMRMEERKRDGQLALF